MQINKKMKLSTYKDLLCDLDAQISKLVQSFCRSETYGYKVCKDKLQKLIHTKQLLENNFNLPEMSKLFYSCTSNEDGTVKTIKRFNKIVGNKIELIVKTSTKTLDTTREFRFELPEKTVPIEGFYIYSLWINIKLNSVEDVEKVLLILENINYLGFFNFQYDPLTNEIFSNESYSYTEVFSYEYVDFDVINTLQCLNEKTITSLIEKNK
jgi:hypothetical protein